METSAMWLETTEVRLEGLLCYVPTQEMSNICSCC